MFVVKGALHYLFWIFVYITNGSFARSLSANFPDVKFIEQRIMAICILNFEAYIGIKM